MNLRFLILVLGFFFVIFRGFLDGIFFLYIEKLVFKGEHLWLHFFEFSLVFFISLGKRVLIAVSWVRRTWLRRFLYLVTIRSRVALSVGLLLYENIFYIFLEISFEFVFFYYLFSLVLGKYFLTVNVNNLLDCFYDFLLFWIVFN